MLIFAETDLCGGTIGDAGHLRWLLKPKKVDDALSLCSIIDNSKLKLIR